MRKRDNYAIAEKRAIDAAWIAGGIIAQVDRREYVLDEAVKDLRSGGISPYAAKVLALEEFERGARNPRLGQFAYIEPALVPCAILGFRVGKADTPKDRKEWREFRELLTEAKRAKDTVQARRLHELNPTNPYFAAPEPFVPA